MKKSGRGHSIDFLFPLSLFGIFAVCALFLIVIGAGVYERLEKNMEDTYAVSTAFSYVTEKLRQHDARGQISLITVDGSTALLLTDDINGAVYHTCIGPSGDYLCEGVFSEDADITLSPADAVIEVRDFTISAEDDDFIILSAADASGSRRTCRIWVKTGIQQHKEVTSQ